MEILICTDGTSSSLQSAELVSRLAFPAQSKVVLLGVSDKKIDVGKLNISMDLLAEKLGKGFSISRKIRYGDPSEEILAEAVESSCGLVVMGGGSSQIGLLHPKLGSTASQLSRKLHTHFLVARNLPKDIKKILVCVGGEAPASETMTLGGAWISHTTASIDLLHVIPRKKAAPATTGAREGLTSTDEGQHDLIINNASQQLRKAGVKNEIVPILRQGLIVDEVLNELSTGGYELLVVGAHYQPGADRWQGTLFDDITDQLLNRSSCSVLII